MAKGKKKRPTLFIVSLVNVFLLSLGHAYNSQGLLWGALIAFSISVIFSRKGDFLPLMLFYLPWSPVLKTDPNAFSFSTLVVPIVCLTVLWGGFKKGQCFKIKNFVVPLFFTAYTLFVKLFNALSLQMPYMFFILMLFFIPLYVSSFRKEIRFERCVLFLTAGILSACVASEILMNYPHMLQYIAVDQSEQIGLSRLCGFYGDPNYYSAQILVTIAALLILIGKTTTKSMLLGAQLVSIIALLYFGLQSVSKTFILSLTSLFVVWMCNFLTEKRRISYKLGMILAVVMVVGIVLSTNLFSDQINHYLMRFGRVSDMNSLTTERNTLWGVYLNYLASNIDKLVFGIGLSEDQVRILLKTNNAHNTLIEIMYQLGIVGGLILLWWWKTVFRGLTDKLKMDFSNKVYLLILAGSIFLPWFALDMLYFHEFFYFIILLFLSRNYLAERIKVKSNLNKGARSGVTIL